LQSSARQLNARQAPSCEYQDLAKSKSEELRYLSSGLEELQFCVSVVANIVMRLVFSQTLLTLL
jgi:hypothetical protein